jgi:glutathione synthase/RimK-type ligase-like ATP-grasp enzyme
VRIAFATAPPATIGHEDEDRPLHEAAAAAAGWSLEYRVWSDPEVPWDAYDLVVVRSTWDYLDHLDGYLAWLERMAALGTLENPAGAIRWSLDKRYLVDLAGLGLPVVPGAVCTRPEAVHRALAAASGEVVVKPAVSAGSRATGRFEAGDPRAASLAGEILAGGVAVLVQPALRSLAEVGESSTVVMDGRISHSVRKGPILALGGGLVGGTYTERITPEETAPEVRHLVEQTVTAVDRLAASRSWARGPMLYARVDVATLDDGAAAVLEVELAEPALFLAGAPGAAERFGDAVSARARARAGDRRSPG